MSCSFRPIGRIKINTCRPAGILLDIKYSRLKKVPPLIETARLGIRNWTLDDLPAMAAINANPEVMRYFPRTQTEMETKGFIERAQASYEKLGYTYFAVDHLKDKKMIGFIGLAYQEYESRFTPATDIGWRLHPAYWGCGLATEGARATLGFGLQVLKLPKIISVAVRANKPSIKVMEKIGLKKLGNFQHPLLADYPELKFCVAYGIDRIS